MDSHFISNKFSLRIQKSFPFYRSRILYHIHLECGKRTRLRINSQSRPQFNCI